MQRMTHLLLAGVLSMSMARVAPAIGSSPSPYPQETSMWCWAAGGECAGFLGTASIHTTKPRLLPAATTCAGMCVRAAGPSSTSTPFVRRPPGEFRFLGPAQGPDLCDKKPFCFSWGWTGGGGHLMVVVGYITVGGVDYVVVNDPWRRTKAPNTSSPMRVRDAANHTGRPLQHHKDLRRRRRNPTDARRTGAARAGGLPLGPASTSIRRPALGHGTVSNNHEPGAVREPAGSGRGGPAAPVGWGGGLR
jgi:hypothetical protein